jgi:malate synthase
MHNISGRWDYIFSAIKKLYWDPKHVLPDRATVRSDFDSFQIKL